MIFRTYDPGKAISVLSHVGRKGWTRLKKLVGVSICVYVCAKGQRPEAFNLDGTPIAISQYPKEPTCVRVIKRCPAAWEIASQEAVTENAEIVTRPPRALEEGLPTNCL